MQVNGEIASWRGTRMRQRSDDDNNRRKMSSGQCKCLSSLEGRTRDS